MSSHRFVFLSLAIASLLGLSVIFVRRYSQAVCPQQDQQICSILAKNKKIHSTPMQGTLTLSEDDGEDLVISWSMYNKLSTIQIQKQTNSMLESILSERYVYVKDTQDNEWWREDRDRVENSVAELPFNPSLYFQDIKEKFTDENTTYTFVNELSCQDETCYRYQVTYPEMEEEQLFMLFSKTDYRLRSVYMLEEKSTQELQISYEPTEIIEPETVKVVPAGNNIFLEFAELKDQEEEKNFEYLRQFQQERRELEGEAFIQYVEETPTPIPSVTLLPTIVP